MGVHEKVWSLHAAKGGNAGRDMDEVSFMEESMHLRAHDCAIPNKTL